MGPIVSAIISKKHANGEPVYFLVQSKKDYGEYTGYWYPPGGKVEMGESDREAIEREIKEELGVSVTHLEYIQETRGDITEKITWWKSTVPVEQIQINTTELAGAGFFTKEELRVLPLWPATRLFFETHIFTS